MKYSEVRDSIEELKALLTYDEGLGRDTYASRSLLINAVHCSGCIPPNRGSLMVGWWGGGVVG